VLGAPRSRCWLIVPAVVTSFLPQHAVQGWCPPVPLFRRHGVRSRQEIDAERFATKVLGGDFAEVPTTGDPERRAQAALEAASR